MLDEPTSGLDSAIAYQTMLLLKQLANNGKMVIASIHQPSSEIFNTLDRVLILAKGKTVYFGKVSKLPSYLISIGYECPRYSNVADFTLQKIAENDDFFINKWDEYSLKNNELINLNKKMSTNTSNKNIINYENISNDNNKMAPFCHQLSILMSRQFKIFMRDKVPTVVRMGQAMFTALLEGLLWWQLTSVSDIDYYKTNNDSNDSGETNTMIENTQNRFGAIFYATTFAAMNAIMVANLTFPSQRLVFQKERVGNWYYTTYVLIYIYTVCIYVQYIRNNIIYI